jgi:hypothetical protein
MDYLLLAIVLAAICVAFLALLRVYSKRQLRQGHKSPDRD